VKTDFIDFILKIDVEIHEIRSAISVKYFGPKKEFPGNVLVNLPKIYRIPREAAFLA
jgi:hypothetical protein